MKKAICVFITCLICFCVCTNVVAAELDENHINIDLENLDQESIDNMVINILKKSDVPGASIVLVNGD